MNLIKERHKAEGTTYTISFMDMITQKVERTACKCLYKEKDWIVVLLKDEYWVAHKVLGVAFFKFDQLKNAKMTARRLGHCVEIAQNIYAGFDSFQVILSPEWSRRLLRYDPDDGKYEDGVPFG